jgi:hypothetical protein
MISITTRIYRGFAMHIECHADANPPCRATIRRRFQERPVRRGIFVGANEENVFSQARVVVDQILAGGEEA